MSGRWLPRLLAAPVAGLGVAWMGMVLLDWAGTQLWWRVEPLNLAEAAVLRDRGEVARLVQIGADPWSPSVVREGLVRSQALVLRPVDAAILTGRGDILRLLIGGSALAPTEWRELWCSTSNDRIRTVLDRLRPPGTSSDCLTDESVLENSL